MKRFWITLGVALAAIVLAARRAGAQTDDGAAGDDVTNGTTTDTMRDFALAIAHAEGFFVAGSIPQRANNPGDLVIQGWQGATLGDQRISVFSSPDDGWNRLYRQIALMRNNGSHVYRSTMTLREIGAKWTATDSDDWTANVVEYLQSKGYDVSADSTLEDFLFL